MHAQNTPAKKKSKIEVRNGKSVPGKNPAVKINGGVLPVPLAACSDLGAENGWGSWMGTEGYHQLGGSPLPTFFTPGAPLAPRFNLTSGAGIDPCTPGLGGPPIPVVCPGFGNASVQIGQPNYNGMQATNSCTNVPPLYPLPGAGAAGNGCSEMLTYPLTVGPLDTNFIYAYAIIVENPPSGHTSAQAPFAEIYILDINGDTVPCSHRRYMADLSGGVGPGFFPGLCSGSTYPPAAGQPPNGMDVSYKPWTMEGINLTNYISQTLTVVITNSDCAKGGHYCYSYWDFSCGSFTTNPASYCVGNSVTITAPSDPVIAYTYQWYQNGIPYTGGPNGTSQTIVPFPQPGDTFAVLVSQPSGCPFYVTYVPQPMQVTPNFNYIGQGSCGSGLLSFTDSSYTPNGSPIVSWNWSFPGGTPNSSTAQNPSNISYPTGTYTVTLIVTSSQGCIDTIALPVTVTNAIPPVAAASTVPVCFNNASQFKDLSTGNPTVSQWDWDFGDGTPHGTLQNPTHTYASAGTFTITLIITNSGGCKDTVSLTTVINPLPVANFSSPPVCLHDTMCFTDLSSVNPGIVATWSWNFGDPASGANNTSVLQSPCHVYSGPGTFSVILTVTSDSGCQNTITLPVVVNPPPVAAINPQNVCLNAVTNFTDGSVPAPGDPIKTWDWNFGDGSAHATQQNPAHTYITSGTYTVVLIITSQNGCKDTANIPVTVYQQPVANFSKPDSGCAPICVNYTDLSTSTDGTISSWQWSFPGGAPQFSSSSNPQNICYNTPGNYSVSLVVTTSFGCVDSITLPMIEVYPWPNADFCVTPLIAPATDPIFTFCDMWSNDVVQWSWDFGDNSTDNSNTDPVHSYSASASSNDFYAFNICLHVQNQHGCWDTICKVVELIPEFTFYIPNTFTPNGDPNNDMFFGKGRGIKDYNIWLFDRWGNQIWDCHREDNNTKWDGPGQEGLSSYCQWDGVVVSGGMDMSGDTRLLAQEDVYVWKVTLTDIFDKRHMYVGHVNIVR